MKQRRFPLWCGIFFGLAAASTPVRAAGVDPGAVLVGELNCAACHAASAPARERLFSPPSPVLGEKGQRITPQWLREYLRDPSAAKPGTTMPDALHALSAVEKAAAAEALTHYLVSLQPPPASPVEATDYDAALAARGRTLYHTVGCVACHAPDEPPGRAPEDAHAPASGFAEAQQNSAPLGHLASKTTVAEMAAFLKDPLAVRPGGRMPSLNLGDEEATAIAMYLQRDQKRSGAPGSAPGLHYEYFEEKLTQLPRFERLHAKEKGLAARINLDVHHRDDNFALRFHGNLTIPAEGEYTFSTVSDDGSRLLIDDKPVLANDGIHPAKEVKGRIVLTRGEHALTLLYFNAVGERGLAVYWQGPGIDRQEIPASALSHSGTPMQPVGNEATFALDPAKVARGRQLFASLNCAACHGIEGLAAAPAKPLDALDPKTPGSCAAPVAAAGRPQYTLSNDARAAVQALLLAPHRLELPVHAAERIERTMAGLNCFACHHRDTRGGPEGLRREYFTSSGDADLGDEGRLPPGLDGVGSKLRRTAMENILWNAAVARPYMATRMPQFGQANVAGMPAAFEEADDAGDTAGEPPMVPNGPGFGRKLAGLTGLACIACHNFNKHPALGVPALDMTLMYDRLKPGWFHRYLLDPQALRPGTRMPAFWPEGKAANRDILHGDTELQIAAIREFLSRGKLAELPDGLIAAKMELVATKEAIIYRNFIQGAGPRAIGVGYPEKANLVFDADTLNLPLLWQGGFIDASRHRSGRGMGAEPPLGGNVVSWTPGAPLARLDAPGAPWPAATGKPAGYQFRGYRLDDRQRPTFMYTFGDVQVEDDPVAVAGDLDAGFHRTLTFRHTGPVAGLTFRAAVGDTIQPRPDGSFLVDKKVTVKVTGGPADCRPVGGKWELRVPVTFTEGAATVEEYLSW